MPADGFYEWTGTKGHKQPIWFHRPDRALLFFAGLVDDVGELGPTFAIVTDAAAGPVLDVHDWAPVVFTAETARIWLATGRAAEHGGIKLLASKVSPRANSIANDDASLLLPVAHGKERLL